MSKLEFSIKGPFQAYGPNNGRTFMDYKPTGFTPQPSHIIGMIGAGLGYRRGSIELKQLQETIQVTIKPIEQISKKYHDFQVVNPRGTDFSTKKTYKVYNKKTERYEYVSALEFYKLQARPEDRTLLPSADGLFHPEGTSKIIKKDYLLNSEFTIELDGDTEELKKVKYGLMHPYYPLYLGRKNCIATKVKIGEIV